VSKSKGRLVIGINAWKFTSPNGVRGQYSQFEKISDNLLFIDSCSSTASHA
jgi:hypothetical protein